jgi:signal recognition particle subunit SRP54
MFESLTEKLSRTFKKLRGYGTLTDALIDESLREVRLSLLEADVHFRVVKDLCARVAERARGQEVMKSLTPAQQVIKIVREELVAVMGTEAVPLVRSKTPPVAVMMVGLQGSGKTTTLGKLARHLVGNGQKVILVACDIHRPAAAEQLATLGRQLEVETVVPEKGEALSRLATRALNRAAHAGADYALFDTAGRHHIDREMMDEIVELSREARPAETLLVADAMTGQDAVNVAQGFARELTLTGVILTKFDGDARGGAALSIRQVLGVPIKFVGVGEKLDALEVFHPDRMASRILGMGDVLTLIEKAEAAVNREEAQALEAKIRKNQFTLEDFRQNLRMVKKMGGMEQILGMIPGAGKLAGGQKAELDEKAVRRVEAIIDSMTPGERAHPRVLNMSRRQRVARGSGTDLQEVNRLLKQFEQMQLMMKRFSKMGKMAGAARLRRGLPFM